MVQWAVSVMIMLVSTEKFCMTSEWTTEIASLLFSNHFITSHCSHISMYSNKYRDYSHCTHMSNTKERNLPYHNSNSNGCISCFAQKGSLATYREHFWEKLLWCFIMTHPESKHAYKLNKRLFKVTPVELLYWQMQK